MEVDANNEESAGNADDLNSSRGNGQGASSEARASGRWIIEAGAVMDAAGVAARPGVVLIDGHRIVAAGDPAEVRETTAAWAGGEHAVVRLPNRLVLPAMVNTHVHLGLTDVGRQAYPGSFMQWVGLVLAARPRTEAAVTAAIDAGWRQSLAAGVGWVGDIFDSPASINAASAAGVAGVGFVEIIGSKAGDIRNAHAYEQVGDQAQKQAQQQAQQQDQQRGSEQVHELVVSLTPHAPYSTHEDLYRRAAAFAETNDRVIATHLAELRDELELIADGTGPFAEAARRFGIDDVLDQAGGGQHPVDWLLDRCGRPRWLLAHVNYAADAQIERLAEAQAAVAYCPIASEYFGHENHRYRDMLDAGVNVTIGTDSIVCQLPDEAQPLGVMAQVRRLYRRDRMLPAVLLAMATTHGARALQLPAGAATLQPGAPAKLAAVPFNPDDACDPWVQALSHDRPMMPITPIMSP